MVSDQRPLKVIVNVGDLATKKRAYKRAKKAYERDKSNVELKRAKREAKNALKGEEEASSNDGGATTSSSVIDADAAAATAAITTAPTTIESPEERHEVWMDFSDAGESKGGDDRGGGESSPSAAAPPDDDVVEALRRAYQNALAAFKSERGDKDLLRAKTAALRALDDASLLAASSGGGGTQLTCAGCSKRFVYTALERERHVRLGWERESSQPRRCRPCRTARAPDRRNTSSSSSTTADERRIRLDGRVRNMCYAFQRGGAPAARVANSVTTWNTVAARDDGVAVVPREMEIARTMAILGRW
jgi:hypothetical protein